MSIPQSLDKAVKAAERVLSENANRQYRKLLSFYSKLLLADIVVESEPSNNNYHQSQQSNESYSFEKLIEFVIHHFPLSEYIQSFPNTTLRYEIRDIAWEIESCVIETITYMVNELKLNPFTMQKFVDFPAMARFRAREHIGGQLVELGVPMKDAYVRQFIMGLLAERWKWFAYNLGSVST